MKFVKLVPILLGLAAATAPAATLNVTVTADSGAGSLRAQLAAAASGDTVAITASGTIALSTGEIDVVGKNVNIAGPGANNLTITTNGASRALKITNGQCTISGLTFSNCVGLAGDVDTGGALAVDNFSAGGSANVTTITDCVFANNRSGWGGAVDIFQGGLFMTRCTFAGNTCTGLAFGTNGGGGALSLGPTVASTITNCTFSGNAQNGAATAQPGGGAIYNYGAGVVNPAPVAVEHCTFIGNVDAAKAAGAIKGSYTASYHTAAVLKNCLLVNNQAPTSVLRNFAGNATGSLSTTYASLGGNVTDEGATSGQFMAASGDAVNNSAVAASVSTVLALNGGVIPTHAISRGSPAQRNGQASTVATDERGAPRHPVADSGAFELIEPEISFTVNSTILPEGGTVDLGSTPFNTPVTQTVTITNTQTSPFSSGPLDLGSLALPAGFSSAGFSAASLGNGQSATFDVTVPAATAGLYNASLTFTGNDAFKPTLALNAAGLPNQHSIQLTALVTDTADHWRQLYFGASATNSGLAADSASPSGDGIANLVKYALGLNPQQAYAGGATGTVGFDANGHLIMTVKKNPAATDVSLAIEVTGDLSTPGSWNAAGTTVDQNSHTTLQAHDNTPISSAQTRFIRLKVTRP